jgi:hypothetical protein
MPRIFATTLLLLVMMQPAPATPARANAAVKRTAPFHILPGAYPGRGRASEAPARGAAVSRFTIKGLTVLVEYLEPEGRAAFIRTIDPKAADPFAVPAGRPEFYHAFLVTFENQSPLDVSFQPGNVVLATDHKEQQFPIDLTDLYRTATRLEVDDPERAMQRAAPLIFDSSTTIPRGQRLSRLLVFGPLPSRWKEFHLHFSYLQIGAETHTLSFTFHRQPLEG